MSNLFPWLDQSQAQLEEAPYLPLGPQKELKEHGWVFVEVFREGGLRGTPLSKGGSC